MSFCSKGQAELLRRVANHVKTHGRPIARGDDRRMMAPNSGIHLDYVCQSETRIRYAKRNFDRYASVPGYADYPTKRDRVLCYSKFERLRCEGWEAVLNTRTVHVFGDLSKMTRDLTMLLMSDDLGEARVAS